jgi:ribosomal-protein-alanine N-acetyltransferase
MIGEKELWGNKIAEKSVKIMLKFAFESLCLNSVWGGADEKNIASQRLFAKAGFTRRGIMPQANYFGEGTFSDCHLFSILRKEYEQPSIIL